MIDNIGSRVRKARERLGITQDELARLTGYTSRSSINKIELGHHDVPRKKIEAFAFALQVPADYLMGYENSETLQAMIRQNTPPTKVDDLCMKIQDSDLQDSEVDYIDKQVDFIVGQRK